MTDGVTLAQLEGIIGNLCDGAVLQYHLAKDHSARVEALEKILEFSYASLVRNSHLNKEQGEDELSVTIVEQLRSLSIQATHDTQTGGHCDIHVEGKDHFLWIGEAKIHKDYEWLVKGFLQLSTRYATGGYGQDHGEIVIYCRVRDGAHVLSKWKDLVEEQEAEISVVEDKIEERLWFRTKHKLNRTGLPFYIRHRLIPLFHEPAR
ncbi:hypothetical protein [Mameliella sp. MMSF_3455]|uniref:hypothetical protein n=1 Tax=Mameliella sp. MMSF_3455 TaxID=3046714 RepID=UPI00273E5B30|nr:hypothetical protein [Mameliella sp. MMSF_3455]